MRLILQAFVSFTVVLLAAPAGWGAEPVTTTQRPERLTVTVGDILIRIDGPKMWTLSGIEVRDSVVAVQESAYGSILNIHGVGALGSAHFLDVPGQPGQVEKENVTAVRFFLNDRPVTGITPTMTVMGDSFRMERDSRIRAVQLTSSVILREGVLWETVRMRTAEAVDLRLGCPFMYAWSPTMTDVLFGDDDGVQKRGTFLGNDAKPSEGFERSSRWMAVFDARREIGAIGYLVQQPAGGEVALQYTDAPGVYRKLRWLSFLEKTMPAGFDGTYQSIIGVFQAPAADWEAAALRRLAELKSLAKTPPTLDRD